MVASFFGAGDLPRRMEFTKRENLMNLAELEKMRDAFKAAVPILWISSRPMESISIRSAAARITKDASHSQSESYPRGAGWRPSRRKSACNS